MEKIAAAKEEIRGAAGTAWLYGYVLREHQRNESTCVLMQKTSKIKAVTLVERRGRKERGDLYKTMMRAATKAQTATLPPIPSLRAFSASQTSIGEIRSGNPLSIEAMAFIPYIYEVFYTLLLCGLNSITDAGLGNR